MEINILKKVHKLETFFERLKKLPVSNKNDSQKQMGGSNAQNHPFAYSLQAIFL